MSANAVRIARCRQRQRDGLRVVQVAVDEIALLQKLIDTGLLDLERADDQAAVSEAASKFLAAVLSE